MWEQLPPAPCREAAKPQGFPTSSKEGISNIPRHQTLGGELSLTCPDLCEPRGRRVQVDCLKLHHLVWLCALGDGHTHHGIFLLWDHQHLKHIQRGGQREIKVLESKEKKSSGLCEFVFALE